MKVDRLMSIIILLLEKKRIGAKDLADRFEVSKRTIYRDMDTINMAGIPIRTVPGVGGGFEIMETYKIDNKVFSSKELSTLSHTVEAEELTHALIKIKSVIPEDKMKDIELKANQIHIDLRPWMGNKCIQENLKVIKEALEEERRLSFQYLDSDGEKTRRVVEPCQLILKSSYWYMYGYCLLRQDYRLFKLSRISELESLQERFTAREYPEISLETEEIVNAMSEIIRIRIHQSVTDKVLEYCEWTNFTPDGPNHYLVDFPFIQNDYYYNILLSLGDTCECISPAHVREEMKRKIIALAALYE